MRLGPCSLLVCLLTVSLVGQQPTVAHWPRFRGPNGSGVSETDKPPTTFGPSSNRLWQAVGSARSLFTRDMERSHLRDGRREQHVGRHRAFPAQRHGAVAATTRRLTNWRRFTHSATLPRQRPRPTDSAFTPISARMGCSHTTSRGRKCGGSLCLRRQRNMAPRRPRSSSMGR